MSNQITSRLAVTPKTRKRVNRIKLSFEEDLRQNELINLALDALEKEINASH